MDSGVASINDQVKDASSFTYKLREEIGTVVVGQRYLVDRLLIGLLANGHVLLEGVPGLAENPPGENPPAAGAANVPPHPVHPRPPPAQPDRTLDFQPPRR